jgi:hypothetical protein
VATKTRKLKTKKATPLSTRALAAFLTWKQFDCLLLLETEGVSDTGMISGWLSEIKEHDIHHGGAFYKGTDYSAAYGCLRTLEGRRLTERHFDTRTGYLMWSITDRGRKALDGLKK